MKHLYIILSLFFLVSCNSEPDSLISYCYNFDVRGCNSDLFSDSVDVNQTVDIRESSMSDWLKNQDILVEKVELSIQYYEAHCEACYVCTNGDRYTIETHIAITEDKAEDLELLNFKASECQ